ncbi:hypothetical protein RRG08_016165 [Elysia crispata]|uniref:Uncharacterized protein n=1 Tax=Elysia crispata TaxID=231223 RepID=A0AAE0Z2T6_9GAST|nr:hypothetical protein RRG08_016165 [Elysia crispata]
MVPIRQEYITLHSKLGDNDPHRTYRYQESLKVTYTGEFLCLTANQHGSLGNSTAMPANLGLSSNLTADKLCLSESFKLFCSKDMRTV